MNLYFAVFIESLKSTLWPALSEVYAYAMQAFGGYNMPLAMCMSVTGVTVAGLLLWAAARFMVPAVATKRSARYERLKQIMQRHGKWLLLFTFSPAGFAIAIAAGLFHVPLRIATSLMVVGAAVFYGLVLLV